MSVIIEINGRKNIEPRPRITPGYYDNLTEMILNNQDLNEGPYRWSNGDREGINATLDNYFVEHKVQTVDEFLEQELALNYRVVVEYQGWTTLTKEHKLLYWKAASILLEDLENPIKYDSEENIKAKIKILKEQIKL